jgi:capsular exopolysaccharide synthesis family protein
MANEYPSNALSRRVRGREERPPQVAPQRGGALRGPITAIPQPAEADGLTPKHLLRGLLQHLMTAVVLGVLVGAAGAVAAWYLTPTHFQAKALIQVKAEAPKLLFTTADNARNDYNYVRTQIALLLSDMVIRDALAQPGVADVELFKNAESPREYLRKQLQASNSKSPELIELTLSGEDPRGLATVVNAICETYRKEVVEVETNHRFSRMSHLQQILAEREDDIRRKRLTMGQLAEVVGTSVNPEVANVYTSNALANMSAMRQQWTSKRIELMREELLLKAMESESKDPFGSVPEELINAYVDDDPEVRQLEDQVAAKETLLAETEKLVKKDHPILNEYRVQIETVNRSLAEVKSRVRPRVEKRIQSDMAVRGEATLSDRKTRVAILKREEAQFRAEFEELQKEAAKLGSKSFDLEDLKAELEEKEKFRNKIQDEIHALEVELQAPVRVRVLQEAEIPTHREVKRRNMATIGAGIGGFVAVCLLIAFAEARLRRIMSVDDVSGKLRVMGQVPAVPAWASRAPRSGNSQKTRFWHDMMTESVDAARTLLVHDAEQEEMRIIMVVSAMPSEGKTTLSCHLASSLARAGRRVVLVDCDLRRPNVHRAFGLKNEDGFCEVLLGKRELDDVIQTTTAGGPALLTAGQLTPSVSPLLGTEATEQIFRALKERFEFVIVDSSPVMLVHDTLMVVQHMDAAIVAVRKSVSRQPKVQMLIDRLQTLEVPVLGTLAIGLTSEAHDDGWAYYKGYSKYYSSHRGR